jgi:RNA polymerase sigma-70 factor (ECF subfamily)
MNRWDLAMIDEAENLLRRASARGATGRFQLEAAVQSVHAHRRITGNTDWRAIAGLYDLLYALTGSSVVAINRAAVTSEIDGPAAALAALDDLASDQRLADYQPYWAARAELLARNGDKNAARDAYRRAMGLEHDPAVRNFLARRMKAL